MDTRKTTRIVQFYALIIAYTKHNVKQKRNFIPIIQRRFFDKCYKRKSCHTFSELTDRRSTKIHSESKRICKPHREQKLIKIQLRGDLT